MPQINLDALICAHSFLQLEGELKQRQARQQDEVITDIWDQARITRNKVPKDVQVRQNDYCLEGGWTKGDVELLFERLPEKDINILREFAKLAKRLNTAKKLGR
jgi:serine phosphatase RsbU (regulator of sigma subunit)